MASDNDKHLKEIYERKWNELIEYTSDHPRTGRLYLQTLNMNIAMKMKGYDRVPDIRKRWIAGEENWITDVMRYVNKLYANFDEMKCFLAGPTISFPIKWIKKFRKFYDTDADILDSHYYNNLEFRKLMDLLADELIKKRAKPFVIAD